MRIGSLFSGYGGLDMAVSAVTGATTAWVSDIDKGACKILAHRYPDVPNLGDISAVDWSTIEPVDVLTAGFPCQDVSTAGKRAGLRAGTRTGLWSEVVRAITELQPRMVVLENVLGIFTAPATGDVEPCTWCVGDDPSGNMRALDVVLADLAEIGFDAEWATVRASDIGAPHRRERWFCIAYPAGERWDERLEGRPDAPERRSANVTLLPTPAVNDMGKAYTPDEFDAWTAKMKDAHGNGNGKSLEIEAARLLPTPLTQNNENRQSDRYGPNLGVAILQWRGERWGEYTPAITRWEALTRPAPDPTEQTGRDGAHRLSPRFTEWMMGLPAGWITDVPGITRNQALKACGNGVVPQQATAALRELLARLEAVAA